MVYDSMSNSSGYYADDSGWDEYPDDQIVEKISELSPHDWREINDQYGGDIALWAYENDRLVEGF